MVCIEMALQDVKKMSFIKRQVDRPQLKTAFPMCIKAVLMIITFVVIFSTKAIKNILDSDIIAGLI